MQCFVDETVQECVHVCGHAARTVKSVECFVHKWQTSGGPTLERRLCVFSGLSLSVPVYAGFSHHHGLLSGTSASASRHEL